MRVLCVALFAFLSASCASAPHEAASFRVATYNIRLDTSADGANAWPHRREAVVALLSFYDPDIFGLQEVQAHQLRELKAGLTAFTFIGVGRDDGRESGEFSPLAFKAQRFQLVGSGAFWLSEAPQTPSRGFDAAFPRIVTWARLEEKSGGKSILALNTHWDHVGTLARQESAAIIRDFIDTNRRACEPVVLLGDFNVMPSEASYQALVEGASPLRDAKDISFTPPFGPAGTFNGFDIFRDEPAAIDHIFVSGEFAVIRHGVISQHTGGRLPSDHYPAIADLELTGECGAAQMR